MASAESGLPGYELNGWFGAWAPAETPKQIIHILNRAIAGVLDDPQVRGDLEKNGAVVEGSTPDDFGRYIELQYTKWDKIIKAANIHAE